MPQKKRSAFMEFAEDYAAQKGLCVNKAKMVEIARPIWMVIEIYKFFLNFFT